MRMRCLRAGKDLASVLQSLEVSESTLERWRRQYGGMKAEEAIRLKNLEDENKKTQRGGCRTDARQPDAQAHCGGKLVSPSRRRAAAEELRREFSVSERRGCKAICQPRSSHRYQSKPRHNEARLVRRMLQLAHRRPRFGYRRIAALLRGEGFRASNSRILRLWRKEGLKIIRRSEKSGVWATAPQRLSSPPGGRHQDHVWAWDFIFDKTTAGSPLKWLSIVDEYTRECLTLKCDRSITSEDVIDTLAELFAMRGVPEHIRSDNGPEFVAKAIQCWLEQLGVETLYVEPGSPWENGYAESFHSRFRDEFLATEEFESLRPQPGS